MSHIIDTSSSPHARLASVPLDSVRWTGGYWRERVAQMAEVTIRTLWERLADEDAGHVLANFEIAAGRRAGEPRGTWWQDEWLYKWIEAASCLYRLTGDTWLSERMDVGIELVVAAQADDGYLWTGLAKPGVNRFEFIRHHEVYVMGHLLTAGVVHHRMTGSDSLLAPAVRAADFLCGALGRTVPTHFAHNPSAIMGLVEMHRELGEPRYLDCARLIVDTRGASPAPRGRDLWHAPHGIEGTDQIQDRVPLRAAEQVVGHNVFFTYLFAGAADIVLETGDATLGAALGRMWDDLTGRKMSLTGGVSPMGHGLSLHHDRVVEAVGPAWFLPNDAAYNETCGQVGALMWSLRMALWDPRAVYADMVEHQMYNGVLPGMGLDGQTFWYRNPLQRHAPGSADRGHNDLPTRELPGEGRICCPTNVLRTVVQWQAHAWSVDAEGVWLHQFGHSVARLAVGHGETLEVEQLTDYPWDGLVRLIVRRAPRRALNLRVRLPAWAQGCRLRLNGEATAATLEPGTYAAVERSWHVGDVVELELPMALRLVEAHPRVEHCRNQLAVMRGPMLYCLESTDLPDGVDLADIYLPGRPQLHPVPMSDQPFGLVGLEGKLLHRPARSWTGALYQSDPRSDFAPLSTRLIPYHAWANRGPSAMSVWLPVAWGVDPAAMG